MTPRRLRPRFLVAAALLLAPSASAQTLGPAFASDYSFVDLGTPPSVPSPLGGITFLAGDPNTLLIGGSANGGAGAIYSIAITRDGTGRITGFSGAATLYATAPNIDGGLTYGPGGVLFATGYPTHTLMQFLPGSAAPDRTDNLSVPGLNSSVGTCQFVPAGFAGAGRFLVGSYNASDWYDVTLAPDGNGTFDISGSTALVNTGGGPEGIVFIGGGNPGFGADSALISEYSANAVRAYDLDASGNPDPATRRDFMTGLSGAEGAVIDPVTGDFLFSTFGGGNRVLVVTGFDAPTVFCAGKPNSRGCTPTIGWTGTPTATGADDFIVAGTGFTNGEFGVLAFSASPGAVPFGGGTLCLSGQTLRLPVRSSGGSAGVGTDCSGTFSELLDQAWLAGSGFTVGTSVYVQYLARDTGFAGADAVSLSDGLRFTVQN